MTMTGKTITCRAAVCWEANQPLSIEEVTVDPPQQGEVRIRMVAASLCQTDFACMKGYIVQGFYGGAYPVIPGHEGVGVVESVGPGVTSVQPGDHVVPSFGKQCNKCALCRSNDGNFCVHTNDTSTMRDGTTRIQTQGKALYQLASLGTLSEYAVMDELSVARVNPSVPMDHLSIMGCCVPTGMGTALNEAKVNKGSTCAVWGLGGVGLSIVLGCKIAGATTIIGIDINPEKEAKARQFGCTDFICPKDLDKPVSEFVTEQFGGGCDFTFESAGNTSAMRQAFESCRFLGGKCVIIGAAPPDRELSINPNHLLFGRKISSCLFGGYKFRNDLPALVDMVAEGKIPVNNYITHTVKLDQINEAVDLMKTGKSIRIAIQISST